MAAPTCTIVVIKRFTYRGNANERWSNRYNFTGGTPADATAWRALFDALVLEEKNIYPAQVKVVGGYGYNKVPVTGDHAIWSVDLTVSPNVVVDGVLSTGTGVDYPGDVAVWVRWKLDRLTSKGKPIYLRKYFHGARGTTSGSDSIAANQVTALTNFGGKLRDGTFIGSRVITDKLGTLPIGAGVSSYPTTRTLKRRPKRPPP